jgi:hypothetical protein
MTGILGALIRRWDVVLACTLVFATIGIYLGPAYFFSAWFFAGCAYIIYQALRPSR